MHIFGQKCLAPKVDWALTPMKTSAVANAGFWKGKGGLERAPPPRSWAVLFRFVRFRQGWAAGELIQTLKLRVLSDECMTHISTFAEIGVTVLCRYIRFISRLFCLRSLFIFSAIVYCAWRGSLLRPTWTEASAIQYNLRIAMDTWAWTVKGHFHYGCAALRFAAIVSDSERLWTRCGAT